MRVKNIKRNNINQFITRNTRRFKNFLSQSKLSNYIVNDD